MNYNENIINKKEDDYFNANKDMSLKLYYLLNKMKRKKDILSREHGVLLTYSDVEELVYGKDGKSLTEKQKILFECMRIKKRVLNINDKFILSNIDKLFRLVRNDEIFNDKNKVRDIKEYIVNIEVYLGMPVGLYSVADSLIKEYSFYDDMYTKLK